MAPRRRAERRRPDGASLGFGVALRVFALPGPGIPAHILQSILCLPAEKLLCFGGISPVFRQIARPAGWKFTEIITAEDKDDLKRWRELAKEG